MKNKSSRITIGLIIDGILEWDKLGYYQSDILNGVSDFAKENDVNLMCFVAGRPGSPYEWERARNIMFEFIDETKIDGLIVIPSVIGIYETNGNILKILKGYSDIPIITIGETFEGYNSVCIDNYSGEKKIVDHLVEIHKCKKLAFIDGIKGNDESKIRFSAFLHSLQEHQLNFNENLFYQGNFLAESGCKAVRTFAKNKLEFDGIVAANDNMAIGAMKELRLILDEKAQNIPIIGFDDCGDSKIHNLSTVRQSFMKEAKIAARILVKIIKGEETRIKQVVEPELVIRSSCGCVPFNIKNVCVEIEEKSNLDFKDNYLIIKNFIMKEIIIFNKENSLLNDMKNNQNLVKFEEKLLNKIYNDLYCREKSEFLVQWNSIILWFISNNYELSFLQDLLSCIRKEINKYLKQKEEIIISENLFHSARLRVSDSLQRVVADKLFISSLKTQKVETLGEGLFSILNIEKQMDILYDNMDEFGITKGYVSIYDEPEKPLKSSNIVFAFNGGKRYEVEKNGINYSTLELLPPYMLKDLYNDRFSIIVQTLHQGNQQIGYSIFGFEDNADKIFEVIRYKLSIALKSSLLVENIKRQSANLEIEVKERTKELRESNSKLMEEIHARKEIEEKLNKALKELEVYNDKLKNQSIRDEMTELYNRRGVMEIAKRCYEEALKSKKSFLLFFADLDGLKYINDTFGHDEGDYAIIKISQIFREVFDKNNIIGRLGGDEFIILVSDVSEDDQVFYKAKLEYRINQYNWSSDKKYNLKTSIGGSYFNPEKPMALEELFKYSDEALYIEKQRKKANGKLKNIIKQ
ncbi:diguanylate cyclase [Clostridium sp. DL1XJH146]